MISRLLLFFLVCAGGLLPAQTIISELARLDTIQDATVKAGIITKLLLRFLPGEAPTSGEALLVAYDKNPYLSVLLREPGIRDTILTFNLDSIINKVKLEDRESGRMQYRRVYNRSDIFNNKGSLDIRWLAEEYATPSPLALEQLTDQALRAKASLGATDYSSMVLASLADWIQKRAQEEFTVTFMGKLSEKIQEKNLRYLFPATAKLLLNVDVADYRTFLPDARLAFAEDLQAVTFNFAEFIRSSNAVDADDARLLNLLLVYELLDLSARGLQLPEILAYGRGQLNERRFAAEQKIHLQLAESLRDKTQEASRLETDYMSVVKAYRDVGEELVDEATDLNKKLDTLAKNSKVDSVAGLKLKRFAQLPLVTKSSYSNMFDDEDRHFGQAVSLLKGKLPYQYWLNRPSIDSFRVLFLTDSLPAPDTLRAMGLTMVNAFLQRDGTGKFRIFNRLDKMARTLDAWQNRHDSIELVLQRPSLDRTYIISKASDLSTQISTSDNFWDDNLPNDERRTNSFEYLRRLSASYPSKGTAVRRTARYAIQLAYLQRVDSTYRDYINKLEITHDSLKDPINLSVLPLPSHLDRLVTLRQQFEKLEKTYATFKSRSAAKALKSYQNTQNYEQLLSIGAELLYFLSSPKQGAFAKAKDMASNLIEPETRQVFQGLLYQRIAQQPAFGATLSPRGLADLGTDFSIALGQLYAPTTQDSVTTKLGRYLNFLTTVMNDVLETPLLNSPKGLQPLTSRPGLKKVPDINRRINDLYGLTSTGKYRQAVVPLLDLVELFNVIPDSTKKLKKLTEKVEAQEQVVAAFGIPEPVTEEQKQEKEQAKEKLNLLQIKKNRVSGAALRKFRRYAGFGAALAAAERPSDISAVLDAAALPAGSSRNKRLYRFNVDLNAYFGGAYGRESLINTPDSISSRANTFGMFVPVGASVTWKLSQRKEWSVTLFFPILDLGAITAYRTGKDASTVPKVNFQNVLAPGAHFLLNIPRSPFFIGAGIQYGPNERTIGEQDYSAYRVLGTFGIDVPILNFSRSEN
ncbi:MAG: hypothetical protein ACI81P_002418 [Neolewinella sp.]|jgi:hypothetical protein